MNVSIPPITPIAKDASYAERVAAFNAYRAQLRSRNPRFRKMIDAYMADLISRKTSAP